MIDIFFILFTGGMAVYITIRAAMLDRVEPWYEVAPEEPISPPRASRASADPGPGRRVASAGTPNRPGTGG